MKKVYLITSMVLALVFLGCSDDEDDTPEIIVPLAGEITGGPFAFCVDGVADMVSGVAVNGSDSMGSNSTWVITDDSNTILGLPPTVEALEGVNFDDAGAGVCFIWYLRYEDGLTGAAVGENTADLSGSFDLSNSIRIDRTATMAGELTGGPFEFNVDGEPDMVTGISLNSSTSLGSNSTWVITDAEGNILGLPPTLEDVEGVNFDEAGPGVCLIWYLRYENGLTGLEMGMNANDLEGCFSLSNSVTVNRTQTANAGKIDGGPYTFCVDGTSDFVTDITLDDTNAFGSSSTWVITDTDGMILGLPPSLDAVKGVDFDGAGAGVCLIWYARYEGEIEGAEMGKNANDITGDFDLSNSITVNRLETVAGQLTGGPYEFVVDGTPDMVTDLAIDSSAAMGTSSSYIITDADGKILGLPPTLDDVKGVDFDGAGTGVCFIWYIRYEEGLSGLETDMNANDLEGCFSLSNSIQVTRTEP